MLWRAQTYAQIKMAPTDVVRNPLRTVSLSIATVSHIATLKNSIKSSDQVLNFADNLVDRKFKI